MNESLGVAGSGAIACGLAATAAAHGTVVLWARSEASAERARGTLEKVCGRMKPPVDASNVTITQDVDDLAHCSAVVEAIAEDHDVKVELLKRLVSHPAGTEDEPRLLCTTTSSLSVEQLAADAGDEVAQRFVGLHVFNPVPQMKLVELVFPAAATEDTRTRARELCEALGKTAIEVPDTPGFVVNRLLFPYLFDAVRFMESSGLAPEDIDTCMKLGTGQPMGPLALLDYVGLDVSTAIGEQIGVEIPQTVRDLIADGALGRKTKRGLLSYEG